MKTTSSVDVKLVSRKNGLALQGRIEIQEGFFESPLESRLVPPRSWNAASQL